ncbi:hypothetical protein BD779DRAFT_1670602 [Infundibulicybe gibba]|nr:hypothetical protein BD779DRAFT_1670602 [Infundibulicybe gibba]
MSELQPLLRVEDIDSIPIYPIIHMIKSDVTVRAFSVLSGHMPEAIMPRHFIDTPLTYEALIAPDLTYTLVHPLADKYLTIQRQGNMSVVFCLLLNRVHFIRDDNLVTSAISRSRAHLCEILAIRTLRDLGNSILQLTLTLTTTWPVYNGADPTFLSQARNDRDDDLEERVGNAIEMAIMGKAKRFIKSSSCQKVIDGIWSLKVPSIRSVLEYLNFVILFILFVVAIEVNERDRLNTAEVAFMVYALGFTLEKIAAMQEHGIKVYFKGTWNGFDLAFVTTFCVYAFLRCYGIFSDHIWARTFGIDCLALIACLMFPRLAFVTLKNNLMVLSLRAMMMQFLVLMLIAAFCFCGFLYALWTLSRNQAEYSAGTIAWWMLDLWFGLDASGFDRANQFHPVFGPVLMVTYACLSNTLLLTVLVSILSNTFATINEDAAAEAMFRKAVSTIEGVKADSLFSYQPPVNLIALCIMLPASYILSPRWFHKVNVFMIRITSFPILLIIALYERQAKKNGTTSLYETLSVAAEKVFDTLPRQLKRMTFFEGLAGSGGDIDAIFEIEEEHGSALDTRDDGEGDIHSHHRMASPQPTLQTTPSTNEPTISLSPPQTHPIRTRLMSSLNHGAEAIQSPLAQIFHPLVVDDDNPEPSNPSTNSVPSGESSRREPHKRKR